MNSDLINRRLLSTVYYRKLCLQTPINQALVVVPSPVATFTFEVTTPLVPLTGGLGSVTFTFVADQNIVSVYGNSYTIELVAPEENMIIGSRTVDVTVPQASYSLTVSKVSTYTDEIDYSTFYLSCKFKIRSSDVSETYKVDSNSFTITDVVSSDSTISNDYRNSHSGANVEGTVRSIILETQAYDIFPSASASVFFPTVAVQIEQTEILPYSFVDQDKCTELNFPDWMIPSIYRIKTDDIMYIESDIEGLKEQWMLAENQIKSGDYDYIFDLPLNVLYPFDDIPAISAII